MFITLDLLPIPLQLRSVEGKVFCFDPVRKCWIVAGPEEVVRQKLLQFLITDLRFPKGLIKLEHPLKWNKLSHRSDVVLYNRSGKPFMIIECKAPSVRVTQTTMDQAARYNLVLKVSHLMITNGSHSICCKIDFKNEKFEYLKDLHFVQDELIK